VTANATRHLRRGAPWSLGPTLRPTGAGRPARARSLRGVSLEAPRAAATPYVAKLLDLASRSRATGAS
jgi:hypothetical protein